MIIPLLNIEEDRWDKRWSANEFNDDSWEYLIIRFEFIFSHLRDSFVLKYKIILMLIFIPNSKKRWRMVQGKYFCLINIDDVIIDIHPRKGQISVRIKNMSLFIWGKDN
jgi:hypothetical protein